MPNESLAPFKRLIVFLEKYGEDHPEFREALEKEMADFFNRAKPNRTKINPFSFIEEYGDDKFSEHIESIDDSTVEAYAKFLGIRIKRDRVDYSSLRERVKDAVTKSLTHGEVFSHRSDI